jgi:drug/metabolite transporter (DMT)-like permease
VLRFVILVFLLSASILLTVQTGVSNVWFDQPSFTNEIIALLAISHVGLYSIITRQIGQRPENFVKIYLGSTVLRILFFGLFIFVLIRIDPVSASRNAVLFLITYFLFTSLEVVALYIAVNRQKPTNTGQKEG